MTVLPQRVNRVVGRRALAFLAETLQYEARGQNSPRSAMT